MALVVTQAKISELKNRLSHYLARVRRGESILVLDRNRVIARIEPAGALTDVVTSDTDWLDDLELLGVVKRGREPLPRSWLKQRPDVKADVVRALLEERDEGR